MKSPASMLMSAALSGCAVLSGCATFSPDGGFAKVADAARTDLKLEVSWPRSAEERAKRDAEVAALLAHPLAPDDAVQIALLNNHALQASFQELGVSEADLVQSGRLPNPRFTLRHSSGGGLYDIEETLTFNVVSLLAAPYAHAAEKRRFAQVQDDVIIAVVQLADRTRTAYYTALAARDSLHYARQVKDAAQTSAELAERMRSAGNWNRLDQVRQQSFYDQALQQLARAQLADDSATFGLSRLLGLVDDAPAVTLAPHLPDLPQGIAELPDLERTALQSRIDLQRMRAAMDELARRLKLTKATRFVDVLDAGPTRVLDGTRQDPFEQGYEVSLVVPIFDTGDARVRRSEAIYARSVERFAQAAIDARADVRTAAARYRTAFEMAVRLRDDIIPMHQLISNQEMLRYNASLMSVFDLLADARDQITSVNEYIESVRDFWIAKSHLDTALIANPPREL
ncbi:MAG: TolC family protein [Steroidobacteraceae bacterium]|jgi:outer membrane protein TolC